METDGQILVKDKTAAELLDISVRHFQTLAKTGKIPAPRRLGLKCVRWSTDELRAWVAAGSPPRQQWEQIKKKI